jgi:hypothetical protein
VLALHDVTKEVFVVPANTRPSSAWLWLALFALAVPASASATPEDTVTLDGLQWAAASNGADVLWRDANAFCRDLELAGHDDWRLHSLAELETLHDPEQPGGIRAELDIDDCCLWSATTLTERTAPGAEGTALDSSRYHWGFLYDGGIRYYSIDLQPDGRALCVREPR